jgi:hypothetical protein
MKAFQRVGAYIKPATRMIQSFGHNASRARVDLNKHEVLRLLAGEPLPTSVDIDEGYVILSLRKKLDFGIGASGQWKHPFSTAPQNLKTRHASNC